MEYAQLALGFLLAASILPGSERSWTRSFPFRKLRLALGFGLLGFSWGTSRELDIILQEIARGKYLQPQPSSWLVQLLAPREYASGVQGRSWLRPSCLGGATMSG